MNCVGVDLTIGDILEARFKVRKNQKVALIGPNGAGKSSLLANFLNLNDFDKNGQIISKNKNLLDLKTSEAAKMGIGIINQQSVVIKDLSLREGLEAINPAKKAEIDDLANSLQIGYLLERELNLNYSGGEMKRAELLQVMIQDPELVLIDELDAGVDVGSRKIIYRELKRWLKHKTAIIVSHDFEIYQVLKIDRLLVIEDKQVVEKDLSYLERIKECGYE